jgi:hypothetical protein
MLRVILELSGTVAGKALLKSSGWVNGFIAANDNDYDIVRSMSGK